MVTPRDPVREDAAAFRRLRYGLGLLGLVLPFLLAFSGRVVDGVVQPTISDVFHTTQRDLLVGGLTAIGVFLVVHRGWRRFPGRWLSPDLIVFLAGIAAMGVAFFPNESTEIATTSQKVLGLKVAPILHYGAALLLYLMMSMTCFLVYAPDAAGWERRFYVWAGRVIFFTGCMVMVLSGIKNNTDGVLAQFIISNNLVFWDESLGVWAFSASWLLKAWLEGRRVPARFWEKGDGRSHRPVPWPEGFSGGPRPGAGTTVVGAVFTALRALGKRHVQRTAPLTSSAVPAQITATKRHRRTAAQNRPRRHVAPSRRRA
ncbi:hypothetical protein [Maritimibacter dapengensis]|uniref:DUF998 domain-containing protein n=1 Tax=Maritimibacter dapengensis TaxID=2836868 RepID=A0ABS6T0L3_9RHOB|nr:hypothetical protein [Maritimibacter dapengensis]MBV7378136.1 hypothetical protein [Maritimibacter dapengensis]